MILNRQYPNSFIQLVQRAQQLEISGKDSAAESLYLELLQQFPYPTEINTALAQIYQKRGDLKKLSCVLERLVEDNPEQAYYKITLAANLIQLERFESAEMIMSHIPLESEDPNVDFELARLYASLEKYERAETIYKNLLRRSVPNQEVIYNNLANIYSHLRKEDKARNSLVQALRLNPSYQPAQINYAGMLEESGQQDSAKQLYLDILEQSIDNSLVIGRLIPLLDEAELKELKTHVENLLQGSLPEETRAELTFSLATICDRLKDFSSAFDYALKANSIIHDPDAYQPEEQEALTQHILQGSFAASEQRQTLESTVSPVFICGAYRSGSTLVEQILATSPAISPLEEVKFWSLQDKNLIWELLRENKILDGETRQRLVNKYMARLSSATNKRIVTDKNPDNIWWVGILKQLFPQARFIFTRRNLLDTAISILFLQLNKKLSYATDINHILHHLQLTNDLMECWRKLLPDSTYILDYESVAAEPKMATKRLFDFVGIPWSDSALKFYENKNHVRTASIWQVRKPIHKEAVGRWKNYRSRLLKHSSAAATLITQFEGDE